MTWYALAMFICDKSDVEKLNFSPRSHCFKMARVEWCNVVLNPGERDDWPLVDLSDLDFTECLIDLFGPMSLVETVELFSACQEFPALESALNKELFMKANSRQWNQKTSELFAAVEQTPVAFRDWAHQKQMGQKDLQPLVSLKNPQEIADLLNQFSAQNLSRSEGKQALDWIVDLHLMGTATDLIAPPESGTWSDRLQQLRHPMTDTPASNSEKAGWPKYVQVVNFRQGDRVLKKMQITYLDKDDLSKKLQRLSKTEPQL